MRALTDDELKSCECFHCGEPVPPGTDFGVEINGIRQSMCCPGCQAVAQLISGSGLARFYEQRTAYNDRPEEDALSGIEKFSVYDTPELLAEFSDIDGDGKRQAALLLGGISCAACTWLIEQTLGRVTGIERAVVNLQHSKLDIRFDPETIAMSDIFARITALGYEPRPFKSSAQREQLEADRRSDLRRLAIAGLGMMQVGMFGIALHAGDIQGIEARYQLLLRWVSLPVAALVVVYSAGPFFRNAWRHLAQGALVMDLPISIAIGLAFVASVWATLSGTGQVYFDSVVMFTFFVLLARFLESRIRQRHLFDLVDAEAALPDLLSLKIGGRWESVPRNRATAGDIALVRAGDTIAVDGTVLDGVSAVREDAFNGEHLPRRVVTGDRVYAGTVNIEGTLQLEVAGSYADSRLAALQRSIEVAQTDKPRLAQISDRIASWFIGGILLVSAITCLVWLQLDASRALWITLSVLVVSCPCALALATPAALTSAASALRRRGVMVRGENALETLARCDHLLLDKTGTLTQGSLQVSRTCLLAQDTEADVLAIAAALQQHSNHPISRAFQGVTPAEGFTDVQYLVGAGIIGARDTQQYRMGSIAFCLEAAPDFPPPPDDSLYWTGIIRDGEPLALIGFDNCLREDAPALLSDARARGMQLQLVTGDSSAHASALASQLAIPDIYTGMSPQAKMAHVKSLQQTGATVAMVGDGLNDAPVLQQADASFAVTGSTDLARAQADFVIGEGGLGRIVDTLDTARRCLAVMYQNFAWALAYNISAIPLAATGHIPPWMAALGMSLSSLLVVANSLRLNK